VNIQQDKLDAKQNRNMEMDRQEPFMQELNDLKSEGDTETTGSRLGLRLSLH